MNKVFVDTDICIDLLSGRQPHNTTAEKLFSFADLEKLELYVSALTFSNIDYVLRSQYSSSHSRL
jgi:predicted nucleic acid-binding protein